MLMTQFIRKHNFTEHPFTKVAAEKEEKLDLYFVEPRYFSEALGDAKNPKSYVVFGPRGGGKSAIRTMIERYCNSDSYIADTGGKILCITYDDFTSLNLGQLNTITLSDHINEILKRGVPKLAIELVQLGLIGDNLPDNYRGLLRWYIDEYMSNLSKLELDSILRTLQSQNEKVRELLNNIIEFYNTIINVLKLEAIQPSKPVDAPKNKRDAISSIHVMEVFARLASQVGFDAVYVLIDKIDETDYTGGDSQKAAKLVAPLLTNIKLLELERCAFKFFLWDNVRAYFGEELRTDRITMKRTEWANQDLAKMLTRRIRAYSLAKTMFFDLFVPEIGENMMNVVIDLSYKSPRDMNRLMEAVFAESAPDSDEDNYRINLESSISGISRFVLERSTELYTRPIVDRVIRLKKIAFTISDVAATFKITGGNDEENIPDKTATNRARLVVEKWKSFGIIKQIEPITQTDSKGRRRSVNQYIIIDPRVVYLVDPRHFLSNISIT